MEPAKLFKRLCSRIWSSSTCTGTKLERGKTLYYIPSETFVKSRGTAGVYVVGTKLVVNLCTERVNLRNFWGGRWKSRWEVDLTADPGVVKGTIELHVHYFENGNLQLQSSKDVEEEITTQHPGSLGDAILRIMKEAEDELQMNLEDMYINMS